MSDWYAHELQLHRREWFCASCEVTFRKAEHLSSHLRIAHPLLFEDESCLDVSSVILGCERTRRGAQTCPLCTEELNTEKFHLHLAYHLQQLALFTLPRARAVDSDTIAPSDEAETSNAPSNTFSNASFETMNFKDSTMFKGPESYAPSDASESSSATVSTFSKNYLEDGGYLVSMEI